MQGAWGIGADRRKAKKIAQTASGGMLRRNIYGALGETRAWPGFAPALSGLR
jgi:hypothetical protein